MQQPIEGYAAIGDTQTMALVGRDGSIDWLCLPRFDSAACFAALLGTSEHGHWSIAPRAAPSRVLRRYRPGTLVLETTFVTPDGAVTLVDCMPPRRRVADVTRQVQGDSGAVPMCMDLTIRPGYGAIRPWLRRLGDGRVHALAGPDALAVSATVPLQIDHGRIHAEFELRAGQVIDFGACWYPSHQPAPHSLDAAAAISDTHRWWRKWSDRCRYHGPFQSEVVGSLVVLEALTYAPTGALVAAPTTSLPEHPGGVRNWDYRYCWLRDATLTLYALTLAGYRSEAVAFRDWLLRAAAGDPSQLQIMYGIGGERRLTEAALGWLPGYAASRPVRVGNAAFEQRQLDVYGELMDTLHQGACFGIPIQADDWALQRALLDFLETGYCLPDEGIWEVRGPPQHFTHSKVMAWVAFDRAVRLCRLLRLPGPIERWARRRDQIHAEVCRCAYDPTLQAFTQAYGSRKLDASALLIPQMGFLPALDRRVIGTIAAIERKLMRNGLVIRYETERGSAGDGLPPGEGAFLACSFWLADCYALSGRWHDAHAMFRRLLRLRNDVGLLSEQVDPSSGRFLGNFPQAFSHIGVVNTAFNLAPGNLGPAARRAGAVSAG